MCNYIEAFYGENPVYNVEGGYYDVYANDQDWGLYFYLRSHS